MTVIPPGGTIGILGGGQLGRMLAMAAARLGYATHVYAPEPDSPAADVAKRFTCAAFDDRAAIAGFAATVDVVTLEFENVPVACLARLEEAKPVRPGARVLAITQDRIAEKSLLREMAIATAGFRPMRDLAEAERTVAELAFPAIVKTARLGYDGKGQRLVEDGVVALAAWRDFGGVPCIIEELVAFRRELSVLVARTSAGAIMLYPPVENRHEDHILRRTIAPATIDAATAAQAEDIARRLAVGMALEGLLAIELFERADGTLLVNELAPRAHNSGHWTLDACTVSQFEQQVRAICGLPLGRPIVLAPAVMENLLGSEIDAWPAILAEPAAHLHLYGKREARPGRKMGHVTRLDLARPDAEA